MYYRLLSLFSNLPRSTSVTIIHTSGWIFLHVQQQLWVWTGKQSHAEILPDKINWYTSLMFIEPIYNIFIPFPLPLKPAIRVADININRTLLIVWTTEENVNITYYIRKHQHFTWRRNKNLTEDNLIAKFSSVGLHILGFHILTVLEAVNTSTTLKRQTAA